MSSHANFHDKEASEYVRKRAVQFITRACLTVKVRAQELLSIPGTAVSIEKGSKGKRQQDAVRSKPGEPPRKQTGELRASVTQEVDEATMTGRVGSNLKKAKALELGTSRGLAPRPWLRRALAEMQTKVDSLLSQIKE